MKEFIFLKAAEYNRHHITAPSGYSENKAELWNWRICTYPNPRSDCIESARAGLTTSEDTLFVSFGDGKLYAFSADEP